MTKQEIEAKFEELFTCRIEAEETGWPETQVYLKSDSSKHVGTTYINGYGEDMKGEFWIYGKNEGDEDTWAHDQKEFLLKLIEMYGG